jgi:hypothetical protein
MNICFAFAPLGVKDVIFEQIVKSFMIALIQDYLHVHNAIIFISFAFFIIINNSFAN